MTQYKAWMQLSAIYFIIIIAALIQTTDIWDLSGI